MTDEVLFERRGPLALLTLNRPEKLNAMNYALNERLLALLDRIEADPGLRAVIVTGAGERAFSAGGDIPEFAASIARGADEARRDFVRRGQRMTARVERFAKPVIAAVNGIAFGGGCELTEAAHLAIASDRAVFAKPEIAIGIPPTFGGTQRMPRLAGRKRALELLLTGDAFEAGRAQELGLVNHVVPHEKLLDAAMDLAERISRRPAPAAAAILAAVARGATLSMPDALDVEADQFARIAERPETRAALDAWIGRPRGVRPPPSI